MKDTIVICPARGKGYAFAISFPRALVEGFKALFQRQDDRAQQNPLWCFKRSSLPDVRAWATRQAQEHILTLYDLTELSKAQRERLEASIWQSVYEEHIGTIVEVLPRLPASALRLSHWQPSHIVLDLQASLGRPLFDQLTQAALPSGMVPRTNSTPLQNSSDCRCYAAPDPRTLRVLMQMHVRNFSEQAFSLVRSFDNGAAHFHDQQDRLWFGAPYESVIGSACDFMVPVARSLPYTVTTGSGTGIFLVVEADAYLQHYCQNIAPAMVSSMSPQLSSLSLVELLRQYHLEAWIQGRVNQLCAAPFEALTPRPGTPHAVLWRDARSWMNPADALLHYLQLSDCEALLRLLGWDEERFHTTRDLVLHLKELRSEAYYHYCEEHAVDLMRERLRSFQRTEIQELATRYGASIPLRTKEKMVEGCTDQRMAADLIGVTEERQRRQGGEVAFADGIPWGRRAPGDLYDSLQRGYLADGAWTLSCLQTDASSIWYTLWEGWPPRTVKERNQWAPHLFIEHEEMSLPTCRWFAYLRGEMPVE